ncbi:MAG: hypothetical protein HY901_19025 [Deltaproteobacteria bacterium]|nr:hypothetical protein [Deltaproteobacteria bacterium]
MESKDRPIRVYYDASTPEATAEALLAQIERDWTWQIDTTGFAVPLRMVGTRVEPGFDMFVAQIDPSTTYTFEVQGDNPATVEADCPVLSVMNSRYTTAADLADASRHLLNHASLHAIDCLEPALPAYDMWSVAIQFLAKKNSPSTPHFLADFQGTPEEPLSWVEVFGETHFDFYSFGSMLYAAFLDQRFGQGDGKLLAEIWRHTAQAGHITGIDPNANPEWPTSDVVNSPTFFDAIDVVLQEKGSSFDEAFAEFAIWRLLVGSYHDGHHFKGVTAITNVKVNTTVELSEMPIVAKHPSVLVGRYGTSYIKLNGVTALSRPLQVTFEGLGEFKWSAQLVCVRSGEEARVLPVAEETSRGSALLTNPSECTAAFLAVENHSEGNFSPNIDVSGDLDELYNRWALVGDYTVSLSAVAVPTLVAVTPSHLIRGQGEVSLTMQGTDFVAGSSLAVRLGDGVTVSSVELVDSSTVRLKASAQLTAAIGRRDVTLVSGDGQEVTLPQGISIDPEPVDAGVVADASLVPSSDAGEVAAPPGEPEGCGCSASGTAFGGLGLLTLLALAATRRRRPRSEGAGTLCG